jgi:hypothetical protein
MSLGETIITDLQADLAGRLNADPYFADVTVLTDRDKDIRAMVSKATGGAGATRKAGKIGACVVVLEPVANDTNANALSGPIETIISIAILENPPINLGASGTGKHCLSLARRIHRVLKLYQPVLMSNPLIPSKPFCHPVESDLAPVAYEVAFHCTETDPTRYQKVSLPIITQAWPDVTITCPTEDVDIYYTVDGSHPWSGNAGATLYAGTFIPQANGLIVIRAAAYKRNGGILWIASDVAAEQYEASAMFLAAPGGSPIISTPGGIPIVTP